MSATPRTDSEVFEAFINTGLEGQFIVVESDFARQLERELAATQAERDALKADAERYRHLREGRNDLRYLVCDGWGNHFLLREKSLDNAIDNAIAIATMDTK
jgi:hypothetical protein